MRCLRSLLIGLFLIMLVYGWSSAKVLGVTMDEVGIIGNAIEVIRSVGLTEINLRRISNGALTGIAQALGDDTRYLTPEQVEIAQRRSQGLIGIRLGIDEDSVLIREVLEGSPAYQAGLKVGDVLIAVDGVGVSADTDLTRRLLKGEPGTAVWVTVISSSDTLQQVKIQRSEEISQAVGWEIVGSTLLLTIDGFAPDTADEVYDLLQAMISMGLNKCIVDLRSNEGGDVDRATEVAALLTASETIGYYADRETQVPLTSSRDLLKEVKAFHFAVLVGPKTASAAELLVAALRDIRGASLVGAPTFGKSTVQRSYYLHNGGVLNLTIGQIYRVTGESWGDRGFLPDVVVRVSGGAPIPPRILLQGDVGLDVLRFQRWLDGCGYHPGPWDGIMGEQTLVAVNRFRSDYGLDPVTELTPMDVLAMSEVYRQYMEGNVDPVLSKAIEVLNAIAQ